MITSCMIVFLLSAIITVINVVTIKKARRENRKSQSIMKRLSEENVWIGDLSGFTVEADRDSGESGELWLIHRCGFQRILILGDNFLGNIVRYAMEHRERTCTENVESDLQSDHD